MIKEKNYKSITITAIGIMVLVIATIGATFAYFSASSTSSKQNVTTGKINLKATSSKVNATNIKPTTWDNENLINNVANTDIAQVKLSVNTYGTNIKNAKFDIYFTTTGIALGTGNGGSLSDIKWKLVDSNNQEIGSGDFTDGNATDPVKANTNPISFPTNVTTENEATKTFILFIYINNNGEQNKLQNMNISATMSATAKQ